MKSFKGFLLNEASTKKAQLGEAAIVYNYNKHVMNMSHKDAIKNGKMHESDVKAAKNFGLIKTQKATALGLKDYISGGLEMAFKGGTNHYPGASDVTPKADIMSSDRKNLISLKMAGDKGEGAQLISSKSAEAAGCVDAGVKHWGETNDLSKLPEFENAMHILEVEMKESIMKDSVIQARQAKADVGEWYINSSGRKGELLKNGALKKYIGEKGSKEYENRLTHTRKSVDAKRPKSLDDLIERHMQAELMAFKVIDRASTYENWFLPEIPQGSGGESKNWKKELIQPSYATIQNYVLTAYVEDETGLSAPPGLDDDGKPIDPDVAISPGSKIKWTQYNHGKDEKRIKDEVKQIVLTSMKTVRWKEELEKFFQTNKEVRKWIVYEAASGLTKFTGKTYQGRGPIYGRVANKMMVFKAGGGLKTWYDSVEGFADGHTDLLSKLDISFKSSGMEKYVKLGVPVNSSVEMPFDKALNECIDAEWSMLNEDIEQIYSEYLTEGFWGNIGKKLKSATSVVLDIAAKVKNKIWQAIMAFYYRVILLFIGKLRKWASQGMAIFLRNAALQVDAAMSMATPAW